MQKIYIDVTNITETEYMTGIQRVVRNVTVELYKMIPEQLVFISYRTDCLNFKIVNSKSYIGYIKDKDELIYEDFGLTDIGEGDIFFDLDSVWNNAYKRSLLLPKLKAQGAKLVVYVYDVIPITFPQYCHENTTFLFMNYLGAYLMYADMIIASAQSTIDEINRILDMLNLPKKKTAVSWLGSDFKEGTSGENKVRDSLKEFEEKKYILAVGTIEPRKNHKYLMEAFDKKLYEDDVKLVFVGREGWNVKSLVNRMNSDPHLNKDFFWFNDLNDDEVGYLYRHAFAVGFPTFEEGFGLPIVEALQRGTVVAASDIPVLREVGREYCRYFDNSDTQSFVDLIEKYLNDIEAYENWRDSIKKFKTFTWRDTSDRIINVLETL